MAIYDHPEISRRYFFPESGPSLAPMRDGEVLRLAVGQETIEAYYHRPQNRAPTALYFHGNGERIAHQLQDWPGWVEAAGINMLFVDYPGYGASEGDPSLSSCRAAARAAIDYLLREEALPYLLVAGRSVGSLFALQAARACPPQRLGGLWLESGVADVAERLALRLDYAAFALDQAAVEEAVRRDFDHRAILQALRCPITIVHARGDSLVTPDNAERLASFCQPEQLELIWLEGDHNTIQWLNGERYPELLAGWVARAARYCGVARSE